ncbi:MAG TPA: hypothetical protein PK668_25005 [Myxococcota bacterium]|nr:hypothetical protein [Myxococcota bacterium]HRY96799.1 hypothetical protein [Myxococcota bacterium]
MLAPVSKEDFVTLGKRYRSEEIINALDRLLPLATADLAALEPAGYTPELLAELTALRDQIRDGSATCRQVRGSKKGARAGEAVVLEEGKNVLRRGVALATVAVARRAPNPEETAQETREKAAELTSQVKALSGRLGKDAALLRTRLITLRALLVNPELNPSEKARAEIQKFLERLDKTVAGITAQAESKKALREQSKDRTVQMDELDGRAYANMRLLAQVGRAVFKDVGDLEHSRMYSLRELSRKKSAQVEKPTAGVQPTPAPVQPRTVEPLPAPAVNG